MLRWATVAATIALAGVFAWRVEFVRLFPGFQPLTVGLSIMTAAVFVRLNRGMPTLDWKSLSVEERRQLTDRVLALTIDYAGIVALFGIAILFVVGLTVIGAREVVMWHPWIQRALSGATGAIVLLCFIRMAYVVWRDVDIVRLQKALLDASSEREASEKRTQSLSDKVVGMKSANLRRVANEAPRPF